MAFTATTVNSASAWAPDLYEFSPQDAVPDALILAASTRLGSIEGDAPVVRVGFVQDDTATFTAEGLPIDEAEPGLNQVLIPTSKITQLVRLSREQYQQSGTADQLSASVSRAITRRGDIAFIGEPAPQAPATAPVPGVVNWPDIVSGDEVSDNLDALVDLVAVLQDNLSTPTHIVLDPLGWAQFRKLKVGGSNTNESLLGAGTTDAQQLLLSLPTLVNVAMPDYTGVVIDRAAVVSATGTVSIATSSDLYFDSDSIAIRATWRIGHAVVRPERIGKFRISAGGS
jgi:HK97 family phage major capsid protein